MNNTLIDPVEISCKYAIFSKIDDDPLFQTIGNQLNKPIFCAGQIESFEQNVYNYKRKDSVIFISQTPDLNIHLSSNLICKFNDIQNKDLIASTPYASLCMKLLREINPKLGDNVLIIGLNFFSVLLVKILELTGAKVKIVNINKNSEDYNRFLNPQNIFNGFDDCLSDLNNSLINTVIVVPNYSPEIKLFLNSLNYNNLFDLNQLSIYDKGYEDPNYRSGIKYPFAYVRWDYKKNLKYYISLVENNIINLDYFNLNYIEIDSIDHLIDLIEKLEENRLFLFRIK